MRLGCNSIFIGKHYFVSKRFEIINSKPLKKLLRNGVNIIHIDEENPAAPINNLTPSDQHIAIMRARYPFYDIESSYSDQIKILHWGDIQNHFLSDLPSYFYQRVAGCPFLDASKVFRNFRRSSNPSSVSFTQSGVILSSPNIKTNKPSALSDYLLFRCDLDFDHALWHMQRELLLYHSVNTVLNNTSLDLCFRPHPESRGIYSKAFISGFLSHDNPHRSVKISFPSSEPALHYLSSSSVSVHTGCTTSIAARFLDLPTIRLEPSRSLPWGPFLHGEPSFNLPDSGFLSLLSSDFSLNKIYFTELAHAEYSNLDPSVLSSFEVILDCVSDFIGKSSTVRGYGISASDILTLVEKEVSPSSPIQIAKSVYSSGRIFLKSLLQHGEYFPKISTFDANHLRNSVANTQRFISSESDLCVASGDNFFFIYKE